LISFVNVNELCRGVFVSRWRVSPTVPRGDVHYD